MTPALGAASLVLPATPTGIDDQRRLAAKPPKEVAREFEALLVAQMIGAMRKTIPESGMLDASASRRMLDGAFDAELARSITAGAGLGVARQLAAQLERRAATSTPAATATDTASHVSRPDGARAAGSVAASAGAAIGADPIAVRASADADHDADASSARVMPVDGRLTSDFGVRRDPLTGTARFHGGIDLAAPVGSAIRAAAAGEVVFSGRNGSAGNMVALRHPDGVVTSYAHAARTLVHPGQKVAAGDVLATVGSTGRSTGPHLHFSVARDGQTIDPSTFLQEAPLVDHSGVGLRSGSGES